MLESTPSIALAVGAGLLTFLSPCVLPIVPSYLALIGAASAGADSALGAAQGTAQGTASAFHPGADPAAAAGAAANTTKPTSAAGDFRVNHFNIDGLLHAIPFVLGFSVVFVALGWSAGWVGGLLLQYRLFWQKLGAVVVFVLALSVLFPERFPWLLVDRRLRPRRASATALGAFLTGLGFAAGWTPCIGPILSSILILSSTDPARSTLLLGAYALGVALPFLAGALYAPSLARARRLARWLHPASGWVLIATAAVLWFDGLTPILSWTIARTGFTGW